MVTYSRFICGRCDQPIKSGRIEKIVKNGKATCYCKHCFQAVLRDA